MGSPIIWGGNGALNLQTGGINLTTGEVLSNNGAKNYLVNPKAETGTTTGWSLGTVTLTSNLPTGTPTFGSGASGNLTLSATSTTPLAGTYSFSYASSAATTAGNFLASDAFTVDSADLGTVLSFSFSYKATSNPSNANWSGTTSNSFAVAIYDVTAGGANWIIPIGVFNITQSSGVGVCTGSFQSSVTAGQQYRIVIYNANASAGAITMYFDQLFVGPTIVGSPALVVNARYHGCTTSIGTSLTTAVFTTADYDTNAAYNNSTGVYTVPITGKYRVSAKLATGAQTTATNAAAASMQVRKNSTAQDLTQMIGSGGSGVNYNISIVSEFQANAGDTIDVQASFGTAATPPASSTQNVLEISLIDNAAITGGPAGQVVAAAAYVSSNFAATTSTPINFDTKLFDTTNSITTSASAWKFIAPVSGYYNVEAAVAWASSTGDLVLYKNGTITAVLATNTGSMVCNGSFVIQMNAGDFLDIRPGSSLTAIGAVGPVKSFMSVYLLQGPSVAQSQNASVNARYFASATSISGSLATVVWTTKDFDSANAMSSGVYTVPVSGKYQINSAVATTGTFALNNQVVIEIQKNSTVVSREKNYAGGTVTDLTAAISDIISCNAGDTIRIQLSSGATGPSIVSSNFENYFSISRVGN